MVAPPAERYDGARITQVTESVGDRAQHLVGLLGGGEVEYERRGRLAEGAPLHGYLDDLTAG